MINEQMSSSAASSDEDSDVEDAQTALAAASLRLQSLVAVRTELNELDRKRAALMVRLASLERQVIGDERALGAMQARLADVHDGDDDDNGAALSFRASLRKNIARQRRLQRELAGFVDALVAGDAAVQ